MFDLGSSRLKDYTVGILSEVAKYLNTVPNRISLSGHTDIRPYPGRNYSNWELSADRANSARRALELGGLEPAKIARVVGLSSSVLFDKSHPEDPINRRISIIVMTKAAEDQALKTDSANAGETEPANSAAAAPAPLEGPIGISTPSTRLTPDQPPVSNTNPEPSLAPASAAPAAVQPANSSTPNR
jgi:chemotaxis protein MotB